MKKNAKLVTDILALRGRILVSTRMTPSKKKAELLRLEAALILLGHNGTM